MTFDIKKKSAKPLTPNTTNTTIFHRQPSSLIEKHMMEDPGIKLFGKKIVLAEFSKTAILPVLSREEKDQLKANYSETKAELDNPKTPSINEESKTEGSEPKTKNPKPKTLEKPDKILACPRCTSMDTKFCYYNNYNVNQPRHFCKSCQRYWTAGGAMRTMQVGAGRRKNKNSIPIHVQQENGFHSKNPWPYNPWNSPIPSPMPVYPSTYLNGIPFLPPSTNASKPIMGKHSRDETLMKTSECDDVLKKPKNSVLIPKTLRIDDPNEASKSSIWVSLGIKNENFKAFQEKGKEGKKHQETTNSVAVHANPAAFSRSICFQENA